MCSALASTSASKRSQTFLAIFFRSAEVRSGARLMDSGAPGSGLFGSRARGAFPSRPSSISSESSSWALVGIAPASWTVSAIRLLRLHDHRWRVKLDDWARVDADHLDVAAPGGNPAVADGLGGGHVKRPQLLLLALASQN